MPHVSVCMPTMRVGGLDVVVHGLQNQTFRDFELCIGDAVPRTRIDCLEQIQRAGFVIKHGMATVNPFPVASFCKFANIALALADGEIIVFITDYTWLPPDCLQRHVDWHTEHAGDRVGLMAPHQYAACPPLHDDFPRYEPGTEADVHRYAADVTTGALDAFGWTIFAEPFAQDPRQMPLCVQAGQDPKLGELPGGIDRLAFHGKNESVKRARAVEVGGWNEALDGTHGWQDSEMADALGCSWTLDPAIVAFIVNPRQHFPFAQRLRDIRTNEALWQQSSRKA